MTCSQQRGFAFGDFLRGVFVGMVAMAWIVFRIEYGTWWPR
jgi:hypothetical protein